jgi:hypothetical protein
MILKESVCLEIAEAGYTWSKQVPRKIDISIYLYRLFLELAELYGPVDPESEGLSRQQIDSSRAVFVLLIKLVILYLRNSNAIQ